MQSRRSQHQLPHRHSALILSLALSLTTLAGCVATPQRYINRQELGTFPSAWGQVSVDRRASELVWNHNNSASEGEQRLLREEIADALELAINASQGGKGAQVTSAQMPARYRLEVNYLDTSFIWAVIPCFGYFIIAGCPYARDSVNVRLHVQVGQSVYTSSARGSAFRGLYYNHDTATGLSLAAVLDGTREALKDLLESLKRDGQL